jgi:hypothetical protein
MTPWKPKGKKRVAMPTTADNLKLVPRAAGAAARFPVELLRASRGRPCSTSTYLVTRKAHVWTSGYSTKALDGLMRRIPFASDTVAPDALQRVQQTWAGPAGELCAKGVTMVPDAFTADEVNQLVAFATDGPARLIHHDGSVSIGTFSDRSPDVVSVTLDMSFVLAQPAIQAMLARAMATSIAMARNRFWPTVHPPLLYWSCRTDRIPDTSTQQRLARQYHSDFDGISGLRLHVYLTDVDEQSGPMDYLPTSHRPGSIPRSTRRDVTDNIPESQVRQLFPDTSLMTITGPAGTSFMSDSNGLHRGNTPVSADRLFLVMPLQSGALAGAFHRRRRVPVADAGFADALHQHRPDLRLFEPALAGAPRFAIIAER